jgi:sugar lactone lactonase YvrE
MPVSGELATTQDIGNPASVASDGAGGFYFASDIQSRVYRVDADGGLSFVAGNGTKGYSGDGGPATSAQLNHPVGIAVDATGNIFIADSVNSRIRKVAPDGVISTVVGNGTKGHSGDGGPATSAQLDGPVGIAVGAMGNLYIADSSSSRIRKVTHDGFISTVAGNGTHGFGGDGGPATSAQLFFPEAVAVDGAGNIFISDSSNSRIRKVTPDGFISTLAGSDTSACSGDVGLAVSMQLGVVSGVAVDIEGNLFIAERGCDRVRKVTPDGLMRTVAGNGNPGYGGDGGPATSAQLRLPQGVSVDKAGNLFIADFVNARIRKVTPDGLIGTVAGNGTYGFSGDGGPATSAQIFNPLGVAVDEAGNLFFADNGNYRVRKVTPDGFISTVAGDGTQGYSGDGGPATSAQLDGPVGIAVDTAGNLFIADSYNARIRKVTPDGFVSTVAGDGNPGYSGDGGPATSARLYWPYGIAVDAAGNLFIADTGNCVIRKVTPDGLIRTIAGNGLRGFGGDDWPATFAWFNYPYGIAVDRAGNLFISDQYNGRIRKVTPSGFISTVAGNGTQGYSGDGGSANLAQLHYPSGVAVDTDGNLYIADQFNGRIRKVTPSGFISTVAGNGTQGYSGDGGPATSAQFFIPYGVAVDTAGNLFISDMENDRIRKVTAIPPCDTLKLSSRGSAMCQTKRSVKRRQDAMKTRNSPRNVSRNSPVSPDAALFRMKERSVKARVQ